MDRSFIEVSLGCLPGMDPLNFFFSLNKVKCDLSPLILLYYMSYLNSIF